MKKRLTVLPFLLLLCIFFSCNSGGPSRRSEFSPDVAFQKGSYGYDRMFLMENVPGLVELGDSTDNARLILSANHQGRVFTSTASGDTGTSFGWVNYNLLVTRKFKSQFNPVGGEERFWLGPEGGQYALYFRKGDSMNFQHWQVPGLIDTAAFQITKSDKRNAVFSARGNLVNYSGTNFLFDIERSIHLLNRADLEQKLNVSIPSTLNVVAFESNNAIKNTSDKAWKKENGLMSIWLLAMFTPSPEAVIIIPFKGGNDAKSKITDDYFGAISPERLQKGDSVLFFRCDGKSRGKLGLPPSIAKPIAASFDFKKNILTIIQFPIDRQGLYVNSKWELQKEPYKGDVLNAYNDGPVADGTQMGPFYEIESSSAAKELKPGESQTHEQLTCHIQGDYTTLKQLAQKLLGVNLDDARKIIGPQTNQ
jgi:hypothetical protein